MLAKLYAAIEIPNLANLNVKLKKDWKCVSRNADSNSKIDGSLTLISISEHGGMLNSSLEKFCFN